MFCATVPGLPMSRHDLSATQRIDELIEQALGAFGTIDALIVYIDGGYVIQ
jgi:hypothetical protein